MAVIRWEPARELQSIQQEMNRLFGTFFDTQTGAGNGGGGVRRWVPAMDLVEEGDRFVLRADLPGVSRTFALTIPQLPEAPPSYAKPLEK